MIHVIQDQLNVPTPCDAAQPNLVTIGQPYCYNTTRSLALFTKTVSDKLPIYSIYVSILL